MSKIFNKQKIKTRRRFLKDSSLTAAALGLSQLPLFAPRTQAQSGTPKKFVQIFLTGGWDSALATDPVIGSKQTSGNYEAVYNTLNNTTITGKNNLTIGPGLAPAKNAFAAMNTAFVNGMFVEVTAHELATNYLYSGRLSLSRSREYPAFIALAGAAQPSFPPFVNIGDRLPLGETALTAPPLTSVVPAGITQLLQGPYNQFEDHGLADRAQVLIEALDRRFGSNLSRAAAESLLPWQNSSSGIPELYAARFPEQMQFTDAIKARYNFTNENEARAPSCLAGAYLTLTAGLSRYVNLAFGNYDTHTAHLAAHTSELQEFATAFTIFVNDLQNTPDPDNTGESLAENTTILILSEFVRTPTFNAQGGTDHWQSGSAIVMGKGVQDNTVIGATDDGAQALGWNGSTSEPRTDQNTLLPDHLAAAVLRHLGYSAVASSITTDGGLDDLFR